jgi:hypothetical protein
MPGYRASGGDCPCMRGKVYSAASMSGPFARCVHRPLLLNAQPSDTEAHGLGGAQLFWRFCPRLRATVFLRANLWNPSLVPGTRRLQR